MAYVLRINPHKYNNSSWGSESPNYEQILVDSSTGLYGLGNTMQRSTVLDPNLNINVGMQSCTNINMCVPSIYVPDITKKLVQEAVDTTGKPTDLDYKVAEEVRDLADSILELPDAMLKTSEPNPLVVGDIAFMEMEDPTKYKYTHYVPMMMEDLLDKDFSPIAKTDEPIVRNRDIPCRPETEYEIPELVKEAYKDKDYQDLLDKLKDLMNDDVMPEPIKLSVDNKDLTERVVNGSGSFDWIASAIFNQLNYVRNEGLINGDDIANVYVQSLVQGLQSAVQFTLEKDKVYVQNLLAFAQLKDANVKALLAKAELLMLPAKMELAYAQLETQRRQIDLLNYQIEVQKLQIPKEAAQLDQIREQTALICIQRKQALEQLAQAELDRKLKEAQIETAVMGIKEKDIDIKLKSLQATQLEVQTQSALVQLEGLKEDVKIKNTQWQLGLKNLKMADAQLKGLVADIKLKAQALLKDREQTALIKAQTATAYAQVVATQEAIKASKAQYSDTIDGAEIGGVLGSQIRVHNKQAEAFDKDAIYKFASTIKDIWTAKKTADIAIRSPNSGTALALDRTLIEYAGIIGISLDFANLPPLYLDAMTDDEMDNGQPMK